MFGLPPYKRGGCLTGVPSIEPFKFDAKYVVNRQEKDNRSGHANYIHEQKFLSIEANKQVKFFSSPIAPPRGAPTVQPIFSFWAFSNKILDHPIDGFLIPWAWTTLVITQNWSILLRHRRLKHRNHLLKLTMEIYIT